MLFSLCFLFVRLHLYKKTKSQYCLKNNCADYSHYFGYISSATKTTLHVILVLHRNDWAKGTTEKINKQSLLISSSVKINQKQDRIKSEIRQILLVRQYSVAGNTENEQVYRNKMNFIFQKSIVVVNFDTKIVTTHQYNLQRLSNLQRARINTTIQENRSGESWRIPHSKAQK